MRMNVRYGEIAWETSDSDSRGDAPAAVAELTPPRPRPTGPRPRNERLPTIRLHGVELHAITERQCIDHILDELAAGRGGVVVTPNLDHLRRCGRDVNFSALVAEADLVVADGMPLIWASKLQGTPLPQRVAGSNLISSLSAAAAKRGQSIFLLGGAPGTAEAAAKILQQRDPELKVAGTNCPEPGFEKDEAAMIELAAKLAAANPNIVYVALGSPKQELLIQRLRQVLPQSWWLGVGVSFSFLCGDVKRAPGWMQKSGLEWVHRLVQEPRRLFHRYIVVGLPFSASLLTRAAARGMPRLWRRRSSVAAAVASMKQYIPHTAPENNGDGQGVQTPVAPVQGMGTRRNAGLRRGVRHTVDTGALPAASTSTSNRSLNKIRALVLLGGSVRSSTLADSVGRSVLDLPLDDNGSIFNHWLSHAADLARHAGLEQLPVRVMVNRNSLEPVSVDPKYYGTYKVERDLSEYRGTGGVLRDLAVDYADDDLVLVANAAQILLDPLAAIAIALDRKTGDITLVSHDDGTPSGVMLVSCKTLRLIPTSGFVDMKEQALPLIAGKFDVTVMHRRRPTGLPIRFLSDYIMAMRHYHRRRLGKPAAIDPLGEDFMLPAFAIAELGSTVAQRAHVHDSVILKGGVVEPGAVVVRSIVCPGGIVRRDRSAVDQLVAAE
jgi:N-acetylglucosaminyldiphosphoundecaprenol N-acetyl-beta-D-mannosaminyltransferase